MRLNPQLTFFTKSASSYCGCKEQLMSVIWLYPNPKYNDSRRQKILFKNNFLE